MERLASFGHAVVVWFAFAVTSLSAWPATSVVESNRLMDFAETAYPSLFRPRQQTRYSEAMAYRYYPETGTYLIVDGQRVFVLGGPFGPAIAYAGVISDYVAPVAPRFPLASAFQARVQNGFAESFVVSGDCGGTVTSTASAASPAIFESRQGFSNAQSIVMSLTGCTGSGATTLTGYFDQTYAPIGLVVPNALYVVLTSAAAPLPSAVQVGDTANYATFTMFTSAAKSTVAGQMIYSYVVERDSDTSVFVVLISKTYNQAGQLLLTGQQRLRLTSTAALTLQSMDFQYSTTSTLHLVYTRQ